jgi:hypothetical protein
MQCCVNRAWLSLARVQGILVAVLLLGFAPVPERPALTFVMQNPDADDYLLLFSRYGKDFGAAYLEPEDERYRLLFELVCKLLMKPSEFNLSMPQEFRTTASRYLGGDDATLRHMRDPLNRHFMLSDLYDYVHLRKTMGGKAW